MLLNSVFELMADSGILNLRMPKAGMQVKSISCTAVSEGSWFPKNYGRRLADISIYNGAFCCVAQSLPCYGSWGGAEHAVKKMPLEFTAGSEITISAKKLYSHPSRVTIPFLYVHVTIEAYG